MFGKLKPLQSIRRNNGANILSPNLVQEKNADAGSSSREQSLYLHLKCSTCYYYTYYNLDVDA